MFSFRELLEKSDLQKESWWDGNSAFNVILPIGLNNFNMTQCLTLGKDAANHVLISGCVGSGKSQLMHVVLTTAMLTYRPNETQIYIVDLKEGLEYQHYKEFPLPHIRRVAAGVERETGYEIMQIMDEELSIRSETILQKGIRDFTEYRLTDQPHLPRILCFIDEFQCLFAKDDYIYNNSGILLDRLVREGSALGVHLLLSSSILSQADSMLRKTLKQITLRVAFSSNHLEEARAILAEGNSAATQLSNPGEAIYNADSGLLEGNNYFQAAYISSEESLFYLEEISALSK